MNESSNEFQNQDTLSIDGTSDVIQFDSNSFADRDVLSLEEYLDGELDSASVVSLETRLQSESTLVQLLVTLRNDRAARRVLFSGTTVDDIAGGLSLERMIASVRTAYSDELDLQDSKLKIGQKIDIKTAGTPTTNWSWKYNSALAACLAVGVLIGLAAQQPVSLGTLSGVPGEIIGSVLANNGQFDLNNQSVSTRGFPMSLPASIHASRRPSSFAVVILDPLGNFVARERFATVEEVIGYEKSVGVSLRVLPSEGGDELTLIGIAR